MLTEARDAVPVGNSTVAATTAVAKAATGRQRVVRSAPLSPMDGPGVATSRGSVVSAAWSVESGGRSLAMNNTVFFSGRWPVT